MRILLKPILEIHVKVDTAAGSLVCAPFSVLHCNVHPLLSRNEHGTQDVVPVIVPCLWTVVEIKVISTFVCHVRSNVESLEFSNGSLGVVVDRVFDNFVSIEGIIFGSQDGCSELGDVFIIVVVSSENSIFHRKSSSEFLLCFWVDKDGSVFSRVVIFEKSVVSSHCLYHKGGCLSISNVC